MRRRDRGDRASSLIRTRPLHLLGRARRRAPRSAIDDDPSVIGGTKDKPVTTRLWCREYDFSQKRQCRRSYPTRRFLHLLSLPISTTTTMPARDPAAAPHIPPPLSTTPPGPGLPTHYVGGSGSGRARSGSSAAAAGMYRELSTSPSTSNRRTSATLGIGLPNPDQRARRVSQGGDSRVSRLFRRLSATSDHSDGAHGHHAHHIIDPVSGVVEDAICESEFEREDDALDECVSTSFIPPSPATTTSFPVT